MKTTRSLLFLILSSWVPFAALGEENTDWIYCVITDEYNNAAYFTEIFHGNYDHMDSYQTEFFEHILSQFGDEIDEGVHCTFEEDKSMTEMEFEQHVADTKDFYDNVVMIDWK